MARRQNVVIKLSLTRAEMLEFRKYVWRFRQERKKQIAWVKTETEILQKKMEVRAQETRQTAWLTQYLIGRMLARATVSTLDILEEEIDRQAREYADRQVAKERDETQPVA